MDKVLEKLESTDMHVHVIDHLAGYKNMDAPIALLAAGTHFIMHGNKIVHIGNENTIERFALRL